MVMSSFSDLLEEVAQNQGRTEIGLAMNDEDLVVEMITSPVPGSPLAKAISTSSPSAQPFILASYLPDNLAYCSASAAKLNGAPGLGNLSSRLFIDISSLFLFGPMPDSQQQGAQHPSLQTLFSGLAAQCSQGRALGITAPPASVPGEVSLVAVYQITSATQAAAAVNSFVEGLNHARGAIPNGSSIGQSQFAINYKPKFEIIGNVPVDLLKVTLNTGAANVKGAGHTPAGKPALPAPVAKPMVIECHIGYLPQKMLVTVGAGSREQMAALIARIQQGQAGFTGSKRFLALKAKLPANVRGFESFATLDLCRVCVNLFETDEAKKIEGLKYLNVLPSPRTVVSSAQECRDGRLYETVTIPGEQLDFFASLGKMFLMLPAKTLRQATTPAAH